MEKRRFWTYENKIVTLFFFSIGFVFFDRLAINYLMPFIQQDFSLSNTQIGMLSAALALTWSFSGPLGGYLSDKAKSKKVLLALIIVGVSAVLMHGLVVSFAMLLVLRLIMGFMEGPVTPITQSVLTVESSESRRGFNMGITMNNCNSCVFMCCWNGSRWACHVDDSCRVRSCPICRTSCCLTIGIGEFFGGFLTPIISGMAADMLGQGVSLAIGSSAAVLAFLFTLLLKETAPAKLKKGSKTVDGENTAL